jgi:FkbM family methyltransferase
MMRMKTWLRPLLGPTYWWSRHQIARLAFRLLRPDRVGMPQGRVLHIDRTDRRGLVLWEKSGNVNPRSMALWQALLNLCPWSLILDVGSNHGEMLLYPDMPASARIYAFEPNAALVPLLRRSFMESGLPATVVQAAVGAADGQIELHIHPQWSGWSSVVAGAAASPGQAVKVPILRLDTFIASLDGMPSGGNLLIKIDVEGHEPAVLEGLMAALSRFEQVAIMAEINHLPPAAFSAVVNTFEVAILDADGRLQRSAETHPSAFSDMDVLLMPKAHADRLWHNVSAAQSRQAA